MAAVSTVGIVGAGAAGLALASFLADAGIKTEILEKSQAPSTLGSGITLQGNALRILRQLGLWEEISAHGYAFNDLGLRAPNPEGTVLAILDEMQTGGADLPATFGMYRPKLAAIMRERALAAGVVISYGKTVKTVEDLGSAVRVHTEGGEETDYDLLVGADGIHSTVRRAIGITAEPQPTGMGIWRAFVPRPAEVVRTDLTYGGHCFIAGYCPTGQEDMYAYLVERAQDRHDQKDTTIMAELAANYGGPWNEIQQSLLDGAPVNYTRFTQHVVDGNWHRGRTVIIGDAAHSCPPTIAQGAAMALEDAAVLAEELIAGQSVDNELWEKFHTRRAERASAVVKASVQLGQWLLDGEKNADVPGLMGGLASRLVVPA
ncbi:FAD-dependent monooxygenase [Arthrobacter sp. NIO-1057]|uniref:FAD-dependent monooxygenase n=1 Tax=Arthrobacter sp. NIO-1057 TaxID=993071 RepID=UPI00071C516D|nr:FAD-dependent monooxygenase [Arthrobacter sp. NIO-1057]KSU65546.1 2-polyprenyl-6-methoxyphenol hydroxylase [Arthrobacter sp. NIO-1057]SCC37889.1 2-polyprenyl-6-methoxyphenol hydroxylase [Arthrobacter sp. NIO-1057]